MPPFPVDPDNDTVLDLILRWAETTPDAIAFIQDGMAPLSYLGLAKAVARIGGALGRLGLAPGARLGIAHSGRAEMAVAILGAMGRAGVIPLNPALTEPEFLNYLHRLGVTSVMVEAGLDTAATVAAEALGLPVIEIAGAGAGYDLRPVSGQPRGRAAGPSPATPENAAGDGGKARSEDVAIILMTSGTTAAGKIIPLRHRHVLARALNQETHFGISASDRCLFSQPLHYANGINQLMSFLSCGGGMVFVPSFTVETFFRHLAENGVTCLSAGVTFLTRVNEQKEAYREQKPAKPLRYIRATSGHLDPEIADQLEAFFGAPVLESYASSETNHICCNPLGPGKQKRGTVGVAAGAEVRIRALDGTFLPAGEPGEVVVRGPQLFEGYENDEQANAEAFADGWFRTGDEGVFDEDGYLTLTGRIKEMINRGGEKVNPVEVDAALMSHPAVHEAATFPIPHPTLGEEVACAIVTAPGESVTRPELTRYLLDRLSGHKVPRRFVFTDQIPRGETAKVQRNKLAETLGVDAALVAGGGETSQARAPSPLEAQLAGIWARVLRLERVGLDDNFFLMGGDSLQAVDLFMEIERALRRRLPVAALFEAGTVAEMARLIEDGETPGCIAAIQPVITPVAGKPPFFCVHGNGGEVIGFHNIARHLGPDQPFYGIQSLGWEGDTAPFTKSEAMAAHYVAEMRAVQPKGPYYLGGYSFGGRIAIYMARQLRAAGEDVAILALLDPISYAGRYFVGLDLWLERRGAGKHGMAHVAETGRFLWFRTRKIFGEAYDRARRAVLFPLWDFYRATGWTVPRVLRRPDSANRLVRLEHANMPPYDGDAVLFKANFTPRSRYHADTRESWDRLIRGRLVSHQIDGRHDQIIQEPCVEALARELALELEKAQKAASTG